MPTSLIVFLNQDLKAAEAIVKVFQDEFETSLKDTFSDDELDSFEAKIDALSAVFVQPIFTELSFDDFTPSQEHKDRQRDFFTSCRSSLSFENLPYLETNPFQVSYLKELIDKFDQCLVDRGGNEELLFKEYFLSELCAYRDLSSLFGVVQRSKTQTQKKFIPIDPIDFLILDVHKEINRLKNHALPLDIVPEKLRKLFFMLKEEKSVDQSLLFQRSGLNPKDFDDGLERLKFILKKIGH